MLKTHLHLVSDNGIYTNSARIFSAMLCGLRSHELYYINKNIHLVYDRKFSIFWSICGVKKKTRTWVWSYELSGGSKLIVLMGMILEGFCSYVVAVQAPDGRKRVYGTIDTSGVFDFAPSVELEYFSDPKIADGMAELRDWVAMKYAMES